MAERALVLGATGFIGAEVARQLRETTGLRDVVHHARSFDARLRPVDAAWELLDLELAGVDDVTRLLRRARPDVVVNCVGTTSGSRDDLRSGNVGVVDKIVDALAVYDARLVHVGSAAEYGSQPVGVPVVESMEPRPFSDFERLHVPARNGGVAVEFGLIAPAAIRALGIDDVIESFLRRLLQRCIAGARVGFAQRHGREGMLVAFAQAAVGRLLRQQPFQALINLSGVQVLTSLRRFAGAEQRQ